MEKEIKDLENSISLLLNKQEKYTNENEVSLYTLVSILHNQLDKYNEKFVNELNIIKELLNKKIDNLNYKGYNIAYIDSICPRSTCLFEPSHIKVYLKDNLSNNTNRVGCVTFYNDFMFDLNLDDKFNYSNTFNFFNQIDFKDYFTMLDNFSKEYPLLDYEWNNLNKDKESKLHDDLFLAYMDIENLNKLFLSFYHSKNINITRENIDEYNKLLNFINSYKEFFMKKIKINIDDLNNTYRIVLNNGLSKNKTMKLKKML